MQKTYTLFFALFLIRISAFCSGNAGELFRIVAVDPINNKVTIQNTSGAENDIADWYLCTEKETCKVIADLTSESTLLANNAKLVLDFDLENDAGDAALYRSGPFNDSDNIRDFMQWGAEGQGSEAEADKVGFWTKGEFLEGSGPFVFDGNLTIGEHGKEFWSEGSLGYRGLSAELFRSKLYPNPVISTATMELNPQLNLSDVQIRIYDLLGSEVKLYDNLKDHSITIDRNNLLKGVYFYSIIQSGKVLDTVKFSVN